MNPEKIKHLEFIQAVITRMNTNSFQLKGWMVVIVSALLAIYADNNNGLYPLFALLPVFIFWGLDAYYLQQERKFRGLYNDVAGLTKAPDKKEIPLFAMPINEYKGRNYRYWKVVFSKTILWLYLPVAVILAVIFAFLTPKP